MGVPNSVMFSLNALQRAEGKSEVCKGDYIMAVQDVAHNATRMHQLITSARGSIPISIGRHTETVHEVGIAGLTMESFTKRRKVATPHGYSHDTPSSLSSGPPSNSY